MFLFEMNESCVRFLEFLYNRMRVLEGMAGETMVKTWANWIFQVSCNITSVFLFIYAAASLLKTKI